MAELHIETEWDDALAAAGLDSFDAMLAFTSGRRMSSHDRGQTYRVELPDGRTIFLKRDIFTSPKDLYVDLKSLRLPQPPCIVETRALHRVGGLNIPCPRPIAWGQRRRRGLPWQAVLVMLPLAGRPLDEFIMADPPADDRAAAMRACGQTVARLYAAGLSWPDLAPKHLYLPEEGEGLPGVLDLARMHPTRRPRWLYMPKEVGRFCRKLHSRGGTDADAQAFRQALCSALA